MNWIGKGQVMLFRFFNRFATMKPQNLHVWKLTIGGYVKGESMKIYLDSG